MIAANSIGKRICLRSAKHPLGADALALGAVAPAESWSATNNKRSEVVMYPAASKSADTLTRQFPYHGDKLSRLAPPFELIERRPPCGTRSLSKGGRLAPILRAEGVLPNLPTYGAGLKRRTPGAYLTRCLARSHFYPPT